MLSLSGIASNLPSSIQLMDALKFIAFFAVAMLIAGSAARLLLGRNSGLNRAISAAMGILSIYILTIIIYTFNPYDLSKFLAPLPFVTFDENALYLFSFRNTDVPVICSQVLSMVILALLVNLLDSLFPRGKKVISWFISRFLTVVLAMVAHYFVCWGFNLFLPGVLAAYAPMILLATLIIMLLIGFANVVLSLILTVVNPIFGIAYTFFFSNLFGKQLTRAVLTTIILCGVVFALNFYGFTAITITGSALQAYIPCIAALLILWYITGRIF